MCIPQLFSCFICTYTTHEQVGRVLHIEMHLQSENKYIPMHVHSSSQPYYPEKKRTDCISLKINSKSHFAHQANVSLVRCSSWHCPPCDHRRECSQMHWQWGKVKSSHGCVRVHHLWGKDWLTGICWVNDTDTTQCLQVGPRAGSPWAWCQDIALHSTAWSLSQDFSNPWCLSFPASEVRKL